MFERSATSVDAGDALALQQLQGELQRVGAHAVPGGLKQESSGGDGGGGEPGGTAGAAASAAAEGSPEVCMKQLQRSATQLVLGRARPGAGAAAGGTTARDERMAQTMQKLMENTP